MGIDCCGFVGTRVCQERGIALVAARWSLNSQYHGHWNGRELQNHRWKPVTRVDGIRTRDWIFGLMGEATLDMASSSRVCRQHIAWWARLPSD